MTTQTANYDAAQNAHQAANRGKESKPAIAFAFDWTGYQELTEGMNMFAKRKLQFEYISYQHWLNPGDMDIETYESMLTEAVDNDPQICDDLAKISYKRIVTHTVEAAEAIKRCAEYARQVRNS